MAIEDTWLRNLTLLVDRLGKGKRRDGYREVAEIARLSEEYIYQLVEQKPKKDGSLPVVGKRVANRIRAAFANGRPESWFDEEQAEKPPATAAAAELAEVVTRMTTSGKMQMAEVEALLAMLKAREGGQP